MKAVVISVVLLLGSQFVAGQGPISEYLAAQKHDFAARSLNGEMIDTTALRGKYVVLNLWFINCPNCLAEIKELNTLVKEYESDGRVVFLAPAASPQDELEKFLKKNPFRYTVIPDAMTLILMKFGTPDKNGDISVPFPMHYVIDPAGRIVVEEKGMKGIRSVREELRRGLAALTAK